MTVEQEGPLLQPFAQIARYAAVDRHSPPRPLPEAMQ